MTYEFVLRPEVAVERDRRISCGSRSAPICFIRLVFKNYADQVIAVVGVCVCKRFIPRRIQRLNRRNKPDRYLENYFQKEKNSNNNNERETLVNLVTIVYLFYFSENLLKKKKITVEI